MSVTIRLARIGKTNAPAYKIVVANTRDKRNGKFLDILGHYNPSHNPELLELDKDKLADWKSKGALITDAVTKLADGKYEYQAYTRQNEVKEEKPSKQAQAPAKTVETAEAVESVETEGEIPAEAQVEPETVQDEPAESSEEKSE